MSEKPRILIVGDDGGENRYTLLIRNQVTCDVLKDWGAFDRALTSGVVYAAAIIMPLVHTPEKRERSFLAAIKAFREKHPETPVFCHCTASAFHKDIKRAGATAIALRPREIEKLIAKHLNLTLPPHS